MKTITLFLTAFIVAGSAHAATTFSGRLVLSPSWEYEETAGASTRKETFGTFLDWTHADGTNANQMSAITTEEITLTNSATYTVDLTSTTDGFGNSVDFHTVRFLFVTADADNFDPVNVGAAAANAFDAMFSVSTNALSIRPGGAALIYAPDLTGYQVSTNGNIKFTNTGTNSMSCTLYVGGSE